MVKRTQWQGAAAGGPAGTWDFCMRACWIGRADKGRAKGTQLGTGGTTLPAPGGQHVVALLTAGADSRQAGMQRRMKASTSAAPPLSTAA